MDNVELIARGLCSTYWAGMLRECAEYPRYTNYASLESFVEGTWKGHITEAKRILNEIKL